MAARDAKSLRGGKGNKGCLVLFFGIFALAGLGVMGFVGLRPLVLAAQAEDWQATECEIVHSEVTSSTSDGSTTYGVDIRYQYEVGGRTYVGERYGFLDISTSGRADKQATVDRYPVGKRAACFVDPEDPGNAVIERDPGGSVLWGLFGLPFFLIGAGGIWWGLRKPRARDLAKGAGRELEAAENPWRRDAGAVATDWDGTLEASQGPVGKFVATLVFTLIWCGISFTMFYFAVLEKGFEGGFQWVPAVFVGLFCLIGLFLLLGLLPYQFLALANPRPHLRIEGGPPRPGARVRLCWNTQGRVDRLAGFTITLTGREEVRYRRGTSTYTDQRPFHELTLYESAEPADARLGDVEFEIPAGTMPSWSAPNNKIIWQLDVHGDIPRWPDLETTYELPVAPPEESAR